MPRKEGIAFNHWEISTNLSNRSQSGMSMVTVLVAGVLMTLMSLGLMQFMTMSQKTMLGIRGLSDRDRLIEMVGSVAKSPAALRTSFDKAALAPTDPENKPYFDCISTTQTCNACTDDGSGNCIPNAYSFRLFDVTEKNIAGTKTNPTFYTLEGMPIKPGGSPCSTADYDCPLEVVTQFEATCQGGAATCAQALRIKVKYLVRQAGNVNLQSKGIAHFKPHEKEITHDVRDINALGAQSCGAGEKNTGVDQYGNIICQSLTGSGCPAGQVVNGVDANGNVQCVVLPPPGHTHFRGVSHCPAGHYVSGLNFQTGEVACSKPRGGGSYTYLSGAVNSCLTGNPHAGGGCGCPGGFAPISTGICFITDANRNLGGGFGCPYGQAYCWHHANCN